MKTKIVFAGFRKDREWPHYAWSVSINGETFDYKTGIGLATPCRKKNGFGFNSKPKDIESIKDAHSDAWAHVPKIDHVLDCLFSEASYGAESFNDFCDSLGYSNDSLKALDVYRACMTSAVKLRKALGSEYHSELDRIQKQRDAGEL